MEGEFLRRKLYTKNISAIVQEKALRNLNLHYESPYGCSHFLTLLKEELLFYHSFYDQQLFIALLCQ